MEIALDKLTLVLAGLLLGLSKVGATNAELGQHDFRRLAAVIFAVEILAVLDHRRPRFPWPIGKHHDVGAKLGGGVDRVLAGGHGIDAPVKGILWPWADLDTRLFVIFAVAFDEAGLQRVNDHRRRLVKAAAGFIHAQAKGLKFAPREPAPHTQAKPALAQHVEHGGILSDPQRIVPGQDNGRGTHVDVRTDRRQISHEAEVVRHEGIIIKVMLGRPEAVESRVGGKPGQPDLLFPHTVIRAVFPAVGSEYHHHANIH